MDQMRAGSAASGAAPLANAAEDVILEVGWRCDPERDRLGPQAMVTTWYRDVVHRREPIVSYILIRRHAPAGATR